MTMRDVRFAEAWLRGRGLPQVLPRSMRREGLLRRVAPLLLALLVIDVAFSWALRVVDQAPDPAPSYDGAPPAGFAAYLLLLVAPILAALAWAAALWAVRRPRVGSTLGVVAAVSWVLVPWVQARFIGERPLSRGVPTRLFVVLVLIALVYVGVGTILSWAARRSLSEITTVGAMSVRILPVFLIAVLFLFFNAEIWQVSNGLDAGRAVVLAGFLLSMALVVVVVTALDEMRELIDSRAEEVDAAEHRRLLGGTPLAAYPVPQRRDPLRWGERMNLLVIAIAVQVLQVVLFAMFMTVFFVAFGQLAITDAVAKAWTTMDVEHLTLEGIELPISTVLLKVAVVLGCFSGLSFAASSSSNSLYRKAFLDPVLVESQVNLAARDAYRHLRRSQASRPAPAPGARHDGADG